MKRILWIMLFLGLLAGPAFGYSLVDVHYTGLTAEREGDVYDYGYFGSTVTGTGGPIGGPIINSCLGYAYQIELFEPTSFSYLTFDAVTYNQTNPDPTGTFSWKLYSGTLTSRYGEIPDINSILISSPVTVEGEQTYDDKEVPFALSVGPGKYWVSTERDVDTSMPQVVGIHPLFYSTADEMAMVHNPEPATMGMLAFGLPFLWRRKNVNR